MGRLSEDLSWGGCDPVVASDGSNDRTKELSKPRLKFIPPTLNVDCSSICFK